jgi:hypothetical protein
MKQEEAMKQEEEKMKQEEKEGCQLKESEKKEFREGTGELKSTITRDEKTGLEIIETRSKFEAKPVRYNKFGIEFVVPDYYTMVEKQDEEIGPLSYVHITSPCVYLEKENVILTSFMVVSFEENGQKVGKKYHKNIVKDYIQERRHEIVSKEFKDGWRCTCLKVPIKEESFISHSYEFVFSMVGKKYNYAICIVSPTKENHGFEQILVSIQFN